MHQEKVSKFPSIKKLLFTVFRQVIVKPLSRRGLGAVPPIAAIYKFVESAILPSDKELISINGYKMITGFGGVGQSLIYDGEYEPQTTAVFKALVKPKMKVIDIGANSGYFTLLASKLVGIEGKVWAFEPEQRNFNDLIDNINLNNLKNIIPIKKAVGDKNGKTVMYVSDVEPGECSLFPCYPSNRDIVDIEIARLDSVFKGSVDIIKSDTEGNELGVLLGAEQLLSRGKDVKLILEFFPMGFKAAGYAIKDLWKVLLRFGFLYMYLLDEKARRTQLITLDDIERYSKRYGGTNALCSKFPVKEIVLK